MQGAVAMGEYTDRNALESLYLSTLGRGCMLRDLWDLTGRCWARGRQNPVQRRDQFQELGGGRGCRKAIVGIERFDSDASVSAPTWCMASHRVT
jgi:hypothetical protein